MLIKKIGMIYGYLGATILGLDDASNIKMIKVFRIWSLFLSDDI